MRELLLVLALLTIAFGLVVSLARRVRSEAAYSLARRELLELEDALRAYRRQYGRLPDVPPLMPRETLEAAATRAATSPGATRPRLGLTLGPDDEPLLRERAAITIAGVVKALGVGVRPEDAAAGPLGGLSALEFDGTTLLDPWGRPIAFLRSGRAEIGIAAGDAPFFFSAGPDGLYLTREDNLYSYEALAAPLGAPQDTPQDAPAADDAGDAASVDNP